MSGRRASPFSPRVALGLVLFGFLSFLALLWIIGSGMDDPTPKASGAHAEGKGLNGFYALRDYLGRRGFTVKTVKSQGALAQPGVLILTPQHSTEAKELQTVVENHRQAGPTIVILPKWIAFPLPRNDPRVKDGYVQLIEAIAPEWKGFYDDIGLERGALLTSNPPGAWQGAGLSGTLPKPDKVFTGKGDSLIPLVTGDATEGILAAYVSDGGDYPGLRALSDDYEEPPADDEAIRQYPVIMVFDADLFDNWGMSQPANAQLAEKLVQASLGQAPRTVSFDLTLDGYGRSRSLLSMAFTPPFLAATLCLLLASAVAIWRAYLRFGPPALAGRSIAFGKRALVANAAGLIHRARRLHLLGTPFADAARERLTRALALPARIGHDQAEAAIDKALAARDPALPSFSTVAAQLRAARKPKDMLRAARQLHALERTLTR